ncbi:MAG: MFS transporter [Inquilinus sp.]|nr:MFS transporter [Inquilinus sp.]
MSYLQFVLRNRRFLAFGVLMTMASSFGQTYFVALFGADIRAEFGLGHGSFGFIYSIATVVSAGCLIWVGRLIDEMPLRRYAVFVCTGLIAATFALAFAQTIVFLFLALFALRLTGQGLMTHTAITGMVRGFSATRGKAVSIANLGMPLAEGTFPIMAVAITATLGWRHSWILFGVGLSVLLVPTVLWLLRDDGRTAPNATPAAPLPEPAGRRWTRGDVLRDPRFYLVLPAVLAPSFIITGMFFHQVHLADSKGWSLTLLATAFIGFSAAHSLTGLATGPAIDRFGATRLMPYVLLPLGCGLLLLTLSGHPAIAFGYMIAAGIGAGIASTTVAAMWAEVYGLAHLGAIRALTTSLGVLSSALSPVLFGWMIDLGVSMDRLALMNLAYVLLAAALVPLAFRRAVAARPV